MEAATLPSGGLSGLEEKPGEAKRRRRRRKLRNAALVVVNLLAFFALWQLLSTLEVLDPLFFPKPTLAFKALYESFAEGEMGEALIWSLKCFFIAMAASALVGIPVGLFMGSNRTVNMLLSPYVWAMASVPRVAITPLLVLIFGFSQMAELVLIFLSAVFPIIINCMAGPKTVDPSLLRAGRVFGASKVQLYLRVVFPFTLPFVISGLNQGLTRGLVGLVIAEFFGGNNGIGYLIQKAGQSFDSPLLYGCLLMLIVVSLTLVQTLNWIERRVAPWRNQDVEA
jgi:ABC-type nitrate/sulfonate/bicarbonate transport system permease component